jgi:hypothetical protein
MLNELKEAAEVYEHGQYSHSFNDPFLQAHILFTVRLADPTNNDAKMKLAEIYEILNEPRKALELVYEGTPFSHSGGVKVVDLFQLLMPERRRQRSRPLRQRLVLPRLHRRRLSFKKIARRPRGRRLVQVLHVALHMPSYEN